MRGWLRRPEWWLAGVLAAASLFVHLVIRPPAAELNFEIYFQLASTFVSGTLVALLAVFGGRLVQALPPARQRWPRLVWVLTATALALAIFIRIRPPRASELMRLLESSALGLVGATTALTLFLIVSGLLPGREPFRVAGEILSRWLAYLTYLVGSPTLMTATLASTPLVWDPVLLRMDLSLGFCPSAAIFAWEIDRDWVRLVSLWGYPLLGLFIAGVAARLHLAGAVAQTRRGLLALTLVAAGGLGCYQLFPAIGPLHAYTALFDSPTPGRSAVVAAVVAAVCASAVAGPDRLLGSPHHLRNVMPSLHTAFTLVALAAAWNWRRRFFWLCLPVGLVLVFTTLTLCVHYVVDVVAAVPFAAACWALADWLVRRTTPAGETPLAPLDSTPAQHWAFAGSVVVATLALLGWAHFALIPPGLAWPLVGVIAGLPAALALRAYRRRAVGAEPDAP